MNIKHVTTNSVEHLSPQLEDFIPFIKTIVAQTQQVEVVSELYIVTVIAS